MRKRLSASYFITLPLSMILFLMFSASVQGQAFDKKFAQLFEKRDTAGQRKLLLDWEKATPNDPEMFIAYFNYYAAKSVKELISIDVSKRTENAVELTDTASGKHVAYMNSTVQYDRAMLQKGFDYINKGIAANPLRLDMRFGKIYMYGEAGDFEEFTKTLVETIDYANSINYKWNWKNGKPLEDGKTFFLGSMQSYNNTIYETEDDDLLPYMRNISEAVLKYNPDHVESLSNVALTYLLNQEYNKALEYLFKAEKVSPTDVIVLNNIAQAYKRMKDKTNAKIYLQKIIKVGSKDEIQNAKEELKELGS